MDAGMTPVFEVERGDDGLHAGSQGVRGNHEEGQEGQVTQTGAPHPSAQRLGEPP